jgi:hypothetical protein
MVGRLNVGWPRAVSDTIRIITAPFTLDTSVLASECSVPSVTFESKWLLTLSLPLLFGVIFALVYVVMRLFASRRIDAGDRIASLSNRVVNAFLLLLSLGYLTMVSTALELFGCTTQADDKVSLRIYLFFIDHLFSVPGLTLCT